MITAALVEGAHAGNQQASHANTRWQSFVASYVKRTFEQARVVSNIVVGMLVDACRQGNAEPEQLVAAAELEQAPAAPAGGVLLQRLRKRLRTASPLDVLALRDSIQSAATSSSARPAPRFTSTNHDHLQSRLMQMDSTSAQELIDLANCTKIWAVENRKRLSAVARGDITPAASDLAVARTWSSDLLNLSPCPALGADTLAISEALSCIEAWLWTWTKQHAPSQYPQIGECMLPLAGDCDNGDGGRSIIRDGGSTSTISPQVLNAVINGTSGRTAQVLNNYDLLTKEIATGNVVPPFPRTVTYPTKCLPGKCIAAVDGNRHRRDTQTRILASLEAYRIKLCKPGDLPSHEVVLAFEIMCVGRRPEIQFACWASSSGSSGITPPHYAMEILKPVCQETRAGDYVGLLLKTDFAEHVQPLRKIPQALISDVGVVTTLDENEFVSSVLHSMHRHHVRVVRLIHDISDVPSLEYYRVSGIAEVVLEIGADGDSDWLDEVVAVEPAAPDSDSDANWLDDVAHLAVVVEEEVDAHFPKSRKRKQDFGNHLKHRIPRRQIPPNKIIQTRTIAF